MHYLTSSLPSWRGFEFFLIERSTTLCLLRRRAGVRGGCRSTDLSPHRPRQTALESRKQLGKAKRGMNINEWALSQNWGGTRLAFLGCTIGGDPELEEREESAFVFFFFWPARTVCLIKSYAVSIVSLSILPPQICRPIFPFSVQYVYCIRTWRRSQGCAQGVTDSWLGPACNPQPPPPPPSGSEMRDRPNQKWQKQNCHQMDHMYAPLVLKKRKHNSENGTCLRSFWEAQPTVPVRGGDANMKPQPEK